MTRKILDFLGKFYDTTEKYIAWTEKSEKSVKMFLDLLGKNIAWTEKKRLFRKILKHNGKIYCVNRKILDFLWFFFKKMQQTEKHTRWNNHTYIYIS